MGLIIDACAILIGGVLGGIFNKKINIRDYSPLAIGIMLISVVGLFENILSVSDGKIVGEHTVVVTIALVVGCTIGNLLKIEDRLCSLVKTQSKDKNGLIDSLLFFGIGGLQISAPILYALEGDSFQLILKGIIDVPFALMFGATYGMVVILSAPIIAVSHILIAAVAFIFGDIISDTLLCQLCSLGYVMLFFSGFNMICPSKNKIKNMNMIPGVFLIIIYNVVMEVFLK